MLALAFPAIDPVLVEVGPFAIRWYALAYVAGIVLGWRYAIRLARNSPAGIDRAALDDFLVWAALGIVLGGRLGYVLFYKPGHFLDDPLDALRVWEGGMSFHGGLLGVAVATALFARRRGLSLPGLGDLVACAAPIGLFLGRLANFVNGELYGRATDVAWAFHFPADPGVARHPSQLYEAALEGLILFVVLRVAWATPSLRARPGALTGLFLAGYGIARVVAEFFREPDRHLGFILEGATMGQLLCLPMIVAGVALFIWAPTLGKAPTARSGKA